MPSPQSDQRDPGAARPCSPAFPFRGAQAVLAAVATVLLMQSALADSLRCNGKLVQVGDPKARLVAECGQPISRDVVAVERAYEDGGQARLSYAEEWSYETAGVEGYRVLRFEAGRLVGQGMRCKGGLTAAGDSTVTVLQKCGEPVARAAAGLVHEPPGPASRVVSQESPIEQWVYSEGEGSLLRIISLRGGRIERIELGPRQ